MNRKDKIVYIDPGFITYDFEEAWDCRPKKYRDRNTVALKIPRKEAHYMGAHNCSWLVDGKTPMSAEIQH